MQQPQFYKTVRASERLPEKEGTYYVKYTTGEYEVLYASGINHEKRWKALVSEWLEPIQLPDAERLREALVGAVADWEIMKPILQRVTKDNGGSEDLIKDPEWYTIAREALSQTGDGWVRVEEYDVPMVKHISNSHWITDGKDVYLAYKAGNNWFSKEDKKLPKAFIPTHVKPHTKPSPPQPINP